MSSSRSLVSSSAWSCERRDVLVPSILIADVCNKSLKVSTSQPVCGCCRIHGVHSHQLCNVMSYIMVSININRTTSERVKVIMHNVQVTIMHSLGNIFSYKLSDKRCLGCTCVTGCVLLSAGLIMKSVLVSTPAILGDGYNIWGTCIILFSAWSNILLVLTVRPDWQTLDGLRGISPDDLIGISSAPSADWQQSAHGPLSTVQYIVTNIDWPLK